jgi:hypothetical protein
VERLIDAAPTRGIQFQEQTPSSPRLQSEVERAEILADERLGIALERDCSVFVTAAAVGAAGGSKGVRPSVATDCQILADTAAGPDKTVDTEIRHVRFAVFDLELPLLTAF